MQKLCSRCIGCGYNVDWGGGLEWHVVDSVGVGKFGVVEGVVVEAMVEMVAVEVVWAWVKVVDGIVGGYCIVE